MRDKIRREKMIFFASRQKEQVSFMGYSIRLIVDSNTQENETCVKNFLPRKTDFQTNRANTNYYHIQRVTSEKEKTIFRYLK